MGARLPLDAGGGGMTAPAGRLPVDADELAACVSCGLCLAFCPTFRVSGEEALSPRGRIAAMREVDAGTAAGPGFARSMSTCVVCRACETACPSAVPFGRLMEGARRVIPVPWWQRAAYRVLEHHRLLLLFTAAGGVAQRAGLVPRGLAERLSLPARLPLWPPPMRATGSDVWLFTGCVMDAWQRPVHAAAVSVLAAGGVQAALPGRGGDCCGALHAHAGLHDRAAHLAQRVMAAMPGEAPILVDSAGCGAAMKEYGRLVEDQTFPARVFDLSEWMAGRLERFPGPRPGWRRPRVAVQDPCHLRHAQQAEHHVRTLLAPYADLVELDDEGRCCGAGGAYSAVQPDLARAIRAQKLGVLEAAGAELVASANPGCALWLARAGIRVAHPIQIVAAATGLGPDLPLAGR